MDRGKEFACFEQVAKPSLGYQWFLLMLMQHGNVALMKIVMVYFESPKKTDLAKVTLDKLTEALVLINQST